MVPPPIHAATHVCYKHNVPSVTSSFRMSKELQRQLSEAAERAGKGKNAIIIEALATYLHAMERQSLVEEAHCRSELVSRKEHDAGWYGLADTSGWR
jgi:predicted DNA-binding protein